MRIAGRVCLLLVLALILWRAEECAGEYYLFSPDYYLNGSLDALYTLDKTAANGTKTDFSSLAQRYTLGLTGPVYGPYIGLFTLNTHFFKTDLTVNDRGADVMDYGVGGQAQFFPTSKYPFSLYFNKSKATSDQFGLQATTDTTTYGFTFNPRFFRGSTFLSYDRSSVEGNAGEGNSFSETRDRANLFYRDGRRFGQDTRVDYEYQFTFLNDNRENRGTAFDSTQATNSTWVTLYTRFGEKTDMLNSFAGNYTLRKEGGVTSRSEAFGSARYEGNVQYLYARNIRGYFKTNHVTVLIPDQPVSNTDALTLTGIYEEVPNPVPRLLLNLQGSAGLGTEWETSRRNQVGNLTMTSRWSGLRFFDVLNDASYTYSHSSGTGQTPGPETGNTLAQGFGGATGDALAYHFGLQGRLNNFMTWYGDYTFQRFGLLTSPPGAGNQHSVSLGETLTWGALYNRSYYTFTKTDIGGGKTASQDHLLWSQTGYRFTPTLEMQALAYLRDTTVSSVDTRGSTATENLSLYLNWNPYPRILVNAEGDVSHSSGTGGSSVGLRLQGTANWLLPFINLRFYYRFEQQDQRSTSGNFKTSEHRLELQATTAFSLRLGSFSP